MKSFTIGVVGNPNSGKTTLFNGLTGGNQRIGNWPGVTVEKKEGNAEYKGEHYHFVDLPGIYSLFAFSEDERIARDYILSEKPDLIVNIVDATNLERNLYLTTQLLEMQVPVLVVLNMLDLAEKEHIKIEIDHLAKHLEVPCIGISAVKSEDITRVFDAVRSALEQPSISSAEVLYPNEVEDVIHDWLPKVTGTADEIGTTERWIVTKILEEEDWITDRVLESGSITREEISVALSKIQNILGEPADAILADYRYGFIHGLVKDVITRTASRRSVTDKIDKVVMHRFFGIPIFFGVMFVVFLVTIGVGERLIGVFEKGFGLIFVDGLSSILYRINAPGWVVSILAGGLGTGIQTVAAFIPIIFLMFFMLSLLEDSGYMARAAFVMDKFMGMLGLPGKSFVPMIVGFGCTVPAIMAARTLDNKRDRIITVFMTPFMSCGARLSVYSVIAAVFFAGSSGMIVFSLYLVGVAVAVLSGLLLKKTIFLGETSHLIMELPPYHTPRLRHIMIHTWNNLRGFIFKAGKFIIIAAIFLSVLNSLGVDGSFGNEGSSKSVLTRIGKIITPVFEPIGVEEENWPASVALFTGIFAKEAVVGTMNALYGQIESRKTDGRQGASFAVMRSYFTKGPAQAYAFLLFVLLYFPCIATLGVAIKEIGKGYGTLMVLYQTLVAWMFATLFFQIVVGHSLAWIIAALGLGITIVLLLKLIGVIVRRRTG
jgi:ferrous iron transport protein B